MILKNCRPTFVSVLMSLSLLLFAAHPVSVYAQGNLTWGKFKVDLGLEYQLEFNDNIFSAPDNEDGDIIHHIIPKIEMGYENEGRPGNYFFLGYMADIARYADFSRNDWERHTPYFSFGYKSPRGLYLTAGDQYEKTSDPYGSANQYNVGIQTKRYSNTANILLGYEFFERYAAEAFYGNYLIRYDEVQDKWQDRTDNRVGFNLVYNLTPRTGLFFQYRYLKADYVEQNRGVFDPLRGAFWSSNTSQDYSKKDFFLGARFKPEAKLNGEIKLGYGTKDYDNGFDISGNPYDDFGDWIAETLFSWQARQRTKYTFELRRSFEGSPDADAAGYIDTNLGLMWDQQMAHRLSFKAAGRWDRNDYQNETSGRPDKIFNIYTLWLVFKWDIKQWLYAGIDYEFTSKQATKSFYNRQEYDRNQLRFFIGGTY